MGDFGVTAKDLPPAHAWRTLWQVGGKPSVATAVPSSVNHRPERTTKPAKDDRVASAEGLDGPLKLAAGERRILTTLAQYPQGRSKVQVAVLSSYAATGGGFNNYLGALRSGGLIEGDGDGLTITEIGIQALGSWEPLPTGSGLVDYWRNRLGKAERLILETLVQAYPAGLNKEEVAARAGYEANGGGFNNALAGSGRWSCSKAAANSGPVTICSTRRWPERFGQDEEGQKSASQIFS